MSFPFLFLSAFHLMQTGCFARWTLACTTCNSQLQNALFDAGFGVNLLLTAAPFIVMIILVLLIKRRR